MNVFISADIEGCTGLVSWSQCGRPDGNHYDFGFARRMMTHDVNAAIRGARRAGANRILVKDSHGNSKNLLLDQLEPGVELVSGTGSHEDGMMSGISEDFDCAMLIGYHAMAGTQGGVMEHTITGMVHRCWLNGQPCGEMGMSTFAAGDYGVPLVCVSSDRAGCQEALGLIPGVRVAETKVGYGRYMAESHSPETTASSIENAAYEGVIQRRDVAPLRASAPAEFVIEFNRSEEADFACRMPGTSRRDAYTVAFAGATYREAHRGARMLMALAGLGAG